MQTRKRAKSVKFGKKSSAESKNQEAKIISTGQIKNQNEIKKEMPALEEIENAQEIKNKIASNISSKIEDDKESEPEEVKLTNETEDSQKNTSQPQSTFGSFTQDVEQPAKRNNLLFFIIIVLVTFIIGLLAIGGFYYFTNKSTLSLSPAPTSTPTAIPSPTEKPVDVSEYSIEVLNGSGISGVAGKLKTQLSDAGFTVDSAGNAEDSDYTKTIISAKETVNKTFINLLVKELEKTYEVDETTKTLETSNNADVVVTVGSSTK